MAKDPAFLFYSSDFISGTVIMSDEEVGQYIRLLSHQHQSGHFSELAMQRLCNGNTSALIRDKFCIDENGLFFNKRLDNEIIRRGEFAEKQRQKAIDRWQKVGNATALPIENVTVNEIENETIIKKGTEKPKKQKPEIKITLPAGWPESEAMELLEIWVRGRKKPTSNELIQIRINELFDNYPLWNNARPKMKEAGLEGWLKLVYPESNKNVLQNGKEPKKAPATLSHELIRDKA